MNLPPPPSPQGSWQQPSGGQNNRTLLVVIAIFSAITALGVVIGLGIWGYSWYQTKQALDDFNESISGANELPDLTGVWTGEFTYPDGTTSDVTLEIDAVDPVNGEMTFNAGPCVVSVTETDSTATTLSFDTESLDDDPDRCAAWGEWDVTVAGSSMDGTLTESAYPDLNGSALSLSRGV